MVLATDDTRTRFETETEDPATPNLHPLLGILLNRLVLDNIVPFLPILSLLNLSATSREFRSLVYDSPGVFRYLDLSNAKRAQLNDVDGIDHGGQVWRNVQLDENLTEDDFYSGPLRGIFSVLRRRDILQDVQTLVLDGLSVTAELCNELINDSSYSVRILSIRDAKSLNHGKLRGSLQYACRSSRPEGSPRLKALYVFGPKDVPVASLASSAQPSVSAEWNQRSQRALTAALEQEKDAWWTKKGPMQVKSHQEGWQDTLVACSGIIAFDAVLCKGPAHRNSPAFGTARSHRISEPAIASIALPPCEGCGSCPEGLTDLSTEAVNLPLLAPPPVLSSSLRAATTPRQPAACFAARCGQCVRNRYCLGCNKWWCETCYVPPHLLQDTTESSVASDMGTLSLTTLPKPKVRADFCDDCTPSSFGAKGRREDLES